jgi:hypothetical protein
MFLRCLTSQTFSSIATALCLTLPCHAAGANTPARAPMKMDQPMPGEMKKPGMKKGDVKKAAERKAQDMKPMMEQEEKMMPRGNAKK